MKIKHVLEDINSGDYRETDFYQKYNKFLYHGSSSTKQSFKPFYFRKKSTDTLAPIHNSMNALTKEKFGLPLRNLLFAAAYENVARAYGTTVLSIVPVSTDYRLFYNPKVNDFYSTLPIKCVTDIRSRVVRRITELRATIAGTIPDTVISIDADDRKKLTLAKAHEFLDDLERILCWPWFRDMIKEDDDLPTIFERIVERTNRTIINSKYFNNEQIFAIIRTAIMGAKRTILGDIENYVNNIEEITTSEQLDSINRQEILVYDPKGFLVVKE